MHLKKIEIIKYKSLENIMIDLTNKKNIEGSKYINPQKDKINKISIFIGPNAIGKSTLFYLIRNTVNIIKHQMISSKIVLEPANFLMTFSFNEEEIEVNFDNIDNKKMIIKSKSEEIVNFDISEKSVEKVENIFFTGKNEEKLKAIQNELFWNQVSKEESFSSFNNQYKDLYLAFLKMVDPQIEKIELKETNKTEMEIFYTFGKSETVRLNDKSRNENTIISYGTYDICKYLSGIINSFKSPGIYSFDESFENIHFHIFKKIILLFKNFGHEDSQYLIFTHNILALDIAIPNNAIYIYGQKNNKVVLERASEIDSQNNNRSLVKKYLNNKFNNFPENEKYDEFIDLLEELNV